MKILSRRAGAIALAVLLGNGGSFSPAIAQIAQLPPVKDWGDSTVPGSSTMLIDGKGAAIGTPTRPLPTIGKQETFQLVRANVAAPAITVAGGDYVLSQTCSGYGTLALQVLGPDAASWLTLASYALTDTGSSHGFVLGSYAKVRAMVSGTTGCNALLSRVPA